MSSKYVRGVKRNQIIQRWLQGIEDPEYEVFPTKKEGKYIVKLRESPIVKSQEENSNNIEHEAEEVPEDGNKETSSMNEPTPIVKLNKPRPRTSSRIIERTTSASDSTINLEILEQLRNLGEEIRNDRFKKEQKQFIKQIVNKELNKSRIRSKYVPDLIPQDNETVEAPPKKEESIQETVYQEPVRKEEPDYVNVQPEPPKFRSRIRR